LLPGQVTELVGPLHSSFLVERGLRTFESDFNVFSLPSNSPELADAFIEAGCEKAKDLIEIVFEPPAEGYQQHDLEEKLTRRLAGIQFHRYGQDELVAKSQALADCYNRAWQRNWGFSPSTAGQFEVAARNIKDMSALIAEQDGEILGFTMFAPAMNEQGLYGRAFFTGVAPEYQKKGLSVALTLKLSAIALHQVGRSKISVSWMLEDNVMVLRTMRHLTRDGICTERVYRIFRYTASVK
jgi:GNAT superfamily N-acetyltransferase